MSNLLWIQSGGCGGCAQSTLLQPELLSRFDALGINILWHPILTNSTGVDFWDLIEQVLTGAKKLDYLCVEGAVLTASGGLAHQISKGGKEKSPMSDLIKDLTALAGDVIAVGSCTAFGGMSAIGSNPAGAMGLQYDNKNFGGFLGREFRSKSGRPVINLGGCAIHPGWFADCLSELYFESLQLDELNRPLFYTSSLVHHGCPRNEFYEYKASALAPNNMGCLMENYGCKATQAQGDCNIRLWPGGGSCLRGGYSCIACTSPNFQNPGHPYLETPKVAGIPSTLPTDMPKAWFVALSSLAKAATPERVKKGSNRPSVVQVAKQTKDNIR
ncbi:MAG: HupU protein [SAR324 cluster bacterium]|nr:HupU protein [SAR324 cluster bacterium]